jgi:hypothetical protein
VYIVADIHAYILVTVDIKLGFSPNFQNNTLLWYTPVSPTLAPDPIAPTLAPTPTPTPTLHPIALAPTPTLATTPYSSVLLLVVVLLLLFSSSCCSCSLCYSATTLLLSSCCCSKTSCSRCAAVRTCSRCVVVRTCSSYHSSSSLSCPCSSCFKILACVPSLALLVPLLAPLTTLEAKIFRFYFNGNWKFSEICQNFEIYLKFHGMFV